MLAMAELYHATLIIQIQLVSCRIPIGSSSVINFRIIKNLHDY
jgi:hypothetical protein